jgi:hypothetical protein
MPMYRTITLKDDMVCSCLRAKLNTNTQPRVPQRSDCVSDRKDAHRRGACASVTPKHTSKPAFEFFQQVSHLTLLCTRLHDARTLLTSPDMLC